MCIAAHSGAHIQFSIYTTVNAQGCRRKKMNFELPMFQDFRGSSDGPIHLTFIVHLVRYLQHTYFIQCLVLTFKEHVWLCFLVPGIFPYHFYGGSCVHFDIWNK